MTPLEKFCSLIILLVLFVAAMGEAQAQYYVRGALGSPGAALTASIIGGATSGSSNCATAQSTWGTQAHANSVSAPSSGTWEVWAGFTSYTESDGNVNAAGYRHFRNYPANTQNMYLVCFNGTPPSSCEAGEVTIATTNGWDTNPNPMPGSKLAFERKPKDLCRAGCKANWKEAKLDASGLGLCTTSATADANGRFPVRCFHTYTEPGESCEPSPSRPDANAEYDVTSPACSGVLTTVAGQSVCIGVGGTQQETPVAPHVVGGQLVPRTTPEEIYTAGSADGGRGTGAPTDGETPWESGGQPRGNPGATISIGGGGSSSATGIVSLDETGTGTGEGAFSDALSAFDSASDAVKGELEKAAGDGKKTDLGFEFPTISWPSVACTPLTLEVRTWSKVIEWCDTLGRVRAMLAWFYSILAAVYIWRSATGALA